MLCDFLTGDPDYRYSWLIPEFAQTLDQELDFTQEARNAERASRLFAATNGGGPRGDVRVPRVVHRLSSRRLMVMEFVKRGIKPDDVAGLRAKGLDPGAVARTITKIFADQILVHGFVHCDPHPGNLLVTVHPDDETDAEAAEPFIRGARREADATDATDARPGAAAAAAAGAGAGAGAAPATSPTPGPTPPQKVRRRRHQVVVLDHGMYRRLTPGFRAAYCQLWHALLLRDEALGCAAVTPFAAQAEVLQGREYVENGWYTNEDNLKRLFNGMSLILTYRSSGSRTKMGGRMSAAERAKVRADFSGRTDAKTIQRTLEGLPRDLLFVYRCTNIVRSINKTLGGTSYDRFLAFGEAAAKGLVLSRRLGRHFAAHPGALMLDVDGVRAGTEEVATTTVEGKATTTRATGLKAYDFAADYAWASDADSDADARVGGETTLVLASSADFAAAAEKATFGQSAWDVNLPLDVEALALARRARGADRGAGVPGDAAQGAPPGGKEGTALARRASARPPPTAAALAATMRAHARRLATAVDGNKLLRNGEFDVLRAVWGLRWRLFWDGVSSALRKWWWAILPYSDHDVG